MGYKVLVVDDDDRESQFAAHVEQQVARLHHLLHRLDLAGQPGLDVLAVDVLRVAKLLGDSVDQRLGANG